MKRSFLTRDAAIARVGLDAVKRCEEGEYDFTGTILDDPDLVEFDTSTEAEVNGEDVSLIAHCYQTKADLDTFGFDFGEMTWKPAGFEIIVSF
jgi:hypothetical protein